MPNHTLNVTDIDTTKRKPLEWASIYYIKLVGQQKIPNKLMNEYEFAWHYINNALSFVPVLDVGDEFTNFTRLNLRAMELTTDLYVNASLGEKEELRKKYIDTSFVRQQLRYV